MLKVISTSDGSKTIYVPELDEYYHSAYGAVEESKHVFINNGYKKFPGNTIRIFELGFGTGLNVLLTLLESVKDKKRIEYLSIEKYPLDKEIIDQINYGQLFTEKGELYFSLIHEAEWDKPCFINDSFSLHKITGDIRDFTTDSFFDIVYYDAFAPGKQPEMWSFDLISKVCSLLSSGGIFITYSARGQLKRDLSKLGFDVEHPDGPRGKRQITRASKMA
jgi:tRNA U34 5-methylaminomethyl-2-thiouridine-forming methyltransferase MnmC